MTPNSTSKVWGITEGNVLGSYAFNSYYGVRPSMYLKSNVVISSTNTGDGTYEHPYDIELVQ